MSSDITSLEPSLLWKWFATICSIPHPSFNETKLINHVANWAKEQGYFVALDQSNNLFLRKAATPGYEKKPAICLQAHFDMVPQSNEPYDFINNPIVPVIKGDYLYADGTTLGADNGIGLASILAVFEDSSLEHGPLEAVLTTGEEVGMLGASKIAYGMLESKLMINTDSEDLGLVHIGCAGGCRAKISKSFNWINKPIEDAVSYTLEIKNLRGGHSGIDIDTNKKNAIILTSELLSLINYVNLSKNQESAKINYYIHNFNGGTASNAIPRSSKVQFSINEDDLDIFLENYDKAYKHFLETYQLAEPTIEISLVKEHYQLTTPFISAEDSEAILKFINLIPNGALKMSELIPDTTENSLSLGELSLNTGQELKATSLLRSISDIGLELMATKIIQLSQNFSFEVLIDEFYPRWKPDITPFKNYVFQRHRQFFGDDACAYKVIHAGLECGVIMTTYPDLDIVSFGPNIKDPHSPIERVEIQSVDSYYKILTDVLKNIPDKLT